MDNYQTSRESVGSQKEIAIETSETIAACATGLSRAGVAIIRISGPLTTTVMRKLLGKTIEPKIVCVSRFLDGNGQVIDFGVALFFQGPNSFTGEDVLELHGHGGPVVVDMLLQRITELDVRIARPGEFSERAFLNNKIDLAQAEAIADLIDSASTSAARSALRSLQGDFSKQVNQIKQDIITLRVHVEAAIDFPEEEIDFLADDKIHHQLASINQSLQRTLGSAHQGQLLRDGISVVIIGEPNVGKSTLLNALSGKPSAIVTDIPGTTRDVMRERILMDDVPLHIIDTAGMRTSPDVIEQEGMRRAWSEFSQADIILLMYEIDQTESYQALLSEVEEKNVNNIPVLIVANKIDLHERNHPAVVNHIAISAQHGDGLEQLKQSILAIVGRAQNQEQTFLARRRHLLALERALRALEDAATQLSDYRAGECAAEDLRCAQAALSEITGEFTSDDLLGEIFSNFCIGK